MTEAGGWVPQVSIFSIALAVVLWLGLPPSAKPAPAHVNAPSAAEVAKLYGAVGRELKALDAAKGLDATIDLWPRYRWIRFNEWIATPEKRAQITRQLERLRAEIRAAS